MLWAISAGSVVAWQLWDSWRCQLAPQHALLSLPASLSGAKPWSHEPSLLWQTHPLSVSGTSHSASWNQVRYSHPVSTPALEFKKFLSERVMKGMKMLAYYEYFIIFSTISQLFYLCDDERSITNGSVKSNWLLYMVSKNNNFKLCGV